MTDKWASEEFEKTLEDIKRAVRLILEGTETGRLEACFVLGCLYNICYQNALDFKGKCND